MITDALAFTLLTLLLVKHWLIDFPLQFPRHYLNKGEYLNWKGMEHSFLHGVGTFVVFYFLVGDTFSFKVSAALGVIDYQIHYHIDWLKVNICDRFGWSSYEPAANDDSLVTDAWKDMDLPTQRSLQPHLAIWSNHYFQALGLDQLAHHLTYIGLVMIAL